MRRIATLLLITACLLPAHAQKTLEADRILNHIKYLSSDALKGRDAGSAGELKAAQYIAAHFKKLGLKGLGSNGSYFQTFKIGEVTTRNVVAHLPGKGSEHIVIGGHFDHVGMGHFGSTWNERGKGKIHNGADDNASGTSVVMELARAFVKEQASLERGIVFILFSGEEKGLLGSKHYADNPLLPLKDCAAMINLDMVGRGKTGKFMVAGTGTAPSFHRLVQTVNKIYKYKIDPMPFGFAPSDNTSFYTKRVPVLFLSTGSHPDYHNPGDDWDKINKDNALCVARFTYSTALAICNAKKRPQHRWAELHPESLLRGLRAGLKLLLDQQRQKGDKPRAKPAARRARLGIMGDESRQPAGVRISRVSRNSAAARAGLKKGDVITALGGKKIAGFNDLVAALKGLGRATATSLSYVRDGKEFAVTVFAKKKQ